jgi:hypothetical protein
MPARANVVATVWRPLRNSNAGAPLGAAAPRQVLMAAQGPRLGFPTHSRNQGVASAAMHLPFGVRDAAQATDNYQAGVMAVHPLLGETWGQQRWRAKRLASPLRPGSAVTFLLGTMPTCEEAG